jgi:hypothetical protein
MPSLWGSPPSTKGEELGWGRKRPSKAGPSWPAKPLRRRQDFLLRSFADVLLSYLTLAFACQACDGDE